MRHASEMTYDEILEAGRRAYEVGHQAGGVTAGLNARLGTMQRVVRELKGWQAKVTGLVDPLLNSIIDDGETCETTGEGPEGEAGVDGCECLLCSARAARAFIGGDR